MTTEALKNIKRNYYIKEPSDIADFIPDGGVLMNEDFWKHCRDVKLDDIQSVSAPELREWYPLVNSYYPYGSVSDHLERVQHLLDLKPHTMPYFKSEEDEEDESVFHYNEIESQIAYLESQPLCFLILGKPGMHQEELGKKLADEWQCVYIEPQTLIEQEIECRTRTGQCIEFNLRLGRSIGIDVILRLIKKRVKSESAKHRGYVICGLPLIPAYFHKSEPISSESAVFTAKDLITDILDDKRFKFVKKAEKEEEEKTTTYFFEEPTIPLDLGDDLDVCHPPEINTNYDGQLDFIFDLMHQPFMLIYMLCGPRDCILRRKNLLFHVYTNTDIDLVKENTNKLLYNFYMRTPEVFSEVPLEVFESYFHDVMLESRNLKHLVVLPRNFPANIENQLDSYYHTLINYLEKKIMIHDPQYFLKIDGRTSTRRMLYIIFNRLSILPIYRVAIPHLIDQHLEYLALDTNQDETLEGKDTIIDESAEGQTHEEEKQSAFPAPPDNMTRYEAVRNMGILADHFKWHWSNWKRICPVALEGGQVKRGDPNFAVNFMNKIFFMSDKDAYLKFYRNPRNYLKGMTPTKACKFFIMGPSASGKTAVSTCLSYIFDATIIRTDLVDKDLYERTEKEFYENVRIQALEEALNILNEKRRQEAQELENQRVENIKTWLTEVKELIGILKQLMIERENELKGETKFELSSFPMAMATVKVTDLETEVTIAIRQTLDELTNKNIPPNEPQHYMKLLHNQNKLLSYLPAQWKKKFVPQPALPDDSFVIEYVENAVSKAVFKGFEEVLLENTINKLVNSLREVEEEAKELGKIRGSWIVDGLQNDLSIIKGVCAAYTPDHVIVLKDIDECYFLRKRYKKRGANRFKDYREFFASIDRADAALKSPSQEEFDVDLVIRDIMSEIFDHPKLDGKFKGKLLRDERYHQELIKFNENWYEIADYFEQNAIELMEVQVTNKSIPDLMKEVLKRIDDFYKLIPNPLTDREKEAERVKIVQMTVTNETIEDDDDEMTTILEPQTENEPEIIRRYGDTYHFCPVTFAEYWVLWKGKEEFAVKYHDNIYLLSTQKNYDKFLFSPDEFLPGKPPEKLPPPRICIIGLPYTGKTALAKALADNYGIEYISYENMIKHEFGLKANDTFEQLRSQVYVPKHLNDYLTENAPLSDNFYAKKVGSLWFHKPTRELGFVIDDFPKRPCDIDFMIELKLIPDIIIEVKQNHYELQRRMINDRLDKWEKNLSDYVSRTENEFKELMKEWEENLPKKFEAMLEEKREARYAQKMKKAKKAGKSQSQVSFDSLADQRDIDEINRTLEQTMPTFVPGPVETVSEMEIKLTSDIQEYLEMESNYLSLTIDQINEEKLPYETLAIDVTDYEKNLRQIYCLTEEYKYRNISHFESCTDINFELAEKFLEYGYYFLSKFGKICPVGYNKKKNPLLRHPVMKKHHNIFPVIHRNYIYFIDGEESLTLFKNNPLYYIDIDKVEYPIMPIKVAVTGPPKCGKTTLANRISQEYEMKTISRGKAIRYVLWFLPFSNLAVTMERVLRKGWEVTDEMVSKCVEAAIVSARGSTYGNIFKFLTKYRRLYPSLISGVVFDGFPNTISETRHMSYYGLLPQLVIDIQATTDQTLECYTRDVGRRGFPKYGVEFIKHLRSEWKTYVNKFKCWFDREYQLMYKISIEPSMWSIWHQSNEIIKNVAVENRCYVVNCYKNWPLRLSYMQVTPLEFMERKSAYDSFCPCCYLLDDVLTTGGSPPDRTGLVQWRNYYYWICNKHFDWFLKTPDNYVPPYGRPPPEHLPTVLTIRNSQPKNLFEDGYCATCFRGKTTLVKGVIELAIYYNDKTYLFDSRECLEEFLKHPMKYCFNISFRPPDNYPTLEYKELPVLGMLEQYLAKDVIKAVQFVSRRRPVIPGLTVMVSAAIGIGLFLKVNNSKLPLEYVQEYKLSQDTYYGRRKKLIDYLARMKSVINPYLHYEEPLPPFRYIASSKTSSISTYTYFSQVVSELVDNVVKDDETDNEYILD
ncbi:unnamed protein product [Phyllotreta striolata]|uniref:Uncharacterized protein n=1 Tax=Phyllotreta striolata TaxID=444603 RepID=A0A9N9XRT1_PHYSR|nr:unnamed protein product [Phyllotreta striolata]